VLQVDIVVGVPLWAARGSDCRQVDSEVGVAVSGVVVVVPLQDADGQLMFHDGSGHT